MRPHSSAILKCENASRCFQPGEGPSRSLLCDCEIFGNLLITLFKALKLKHCNTADMTMLLTLVSALLVAGAAADQLYHAVEEEAANYDFGSR